MTNFVHIYQPGEPISNSSIWRYVAIKQLFSSINWFISLWYSQINTSQIDFHEWCSTHNLQGPFIWIISRNSNYFPISLFKALLIFEKSISFCQYLVFNNGLQTTKGSCQRLIDFFSCSTSTKFCFHSFYCNLIWIWKDFLLFDSGGINLNFVAFIPKEASKNL